MDLTEELESLRQEIAESAETDRRFRAAAMRNLEEAEAQARYLLAALKRLLNEMRGAPQAAIVQAGDAVAKAERYFGITS